MGWIEDGIKGVEEKERVRKLLKHGLTEALKAFHSELATSCNTFNESQDRDRADISGYAHSGFRVSIGRKHQSYVHETDFDRRATMRISGTDIQVLYSFKNANAAPSAFGIRIGVNSNDQVCFQDSDGYEITIEELGKQILSPIFFHR